MHVEIGYRDLSWNTLESRKPHNYSAQRFTKKLLINCMFIELLQNIYYFDMSSGR